jgi:hypothetical protein
VADYTQDHANALADVLAAGQSVTFTLTAIGTYTESTDAQGAPVVTTVTGGAVAEKGSLTQYEAMGLTHTDARTLFFVPTTYGSVPALQSVVSWGGSSYVVKRVEAVDPDGTALGAHVVVSR